MYVIDKDLRELSERIDSKLQKYGKEVTSELNSLRQELEALKELVENVMHLSR